MPHLAVAVMMQRVRARMIQDRKEEVEGVAKMIYKERQSQGSHQQQTDGFADWVEAENRVIRSTFERQTGCTLSLTASMLVGPLPLSLDNRNPVMEKLVQSRLAVASIIMR